MISDALLLESLHLFFNNTYNRDKLLSVLSDDKCISLRSIDWFITNYSKKNNIYYLIYNNKEGNPSFDDEHNEYRNNMNVFHSYKSQLKAYSKKRFDPFCRRDRIEFTLGEEKVISTLGQLNFFKWAINNLILDYIKINYKCIENDMNICYNSIHKKKETNIRKKRQEISKSATRGLNSNNIKVVIDFN